MTKPVYTSPSATFHGIQLTAEIVTLEGESQARVTEVDTGEEILIPARFLNGLIAGLGRVRGDLTHNLDSARREHINLIDKYGLTTYRGQRPRVSLPDRDLTLDQTPYLEWVNDPDKHGWTLRLAGADSVDIAWAAWNNADGIDNLVGLLSDPDTATLMASMVSPDVVAKMTSRIAARRMRADRQLPAVTLEKARSILSRGNVPASMSENPRYNGSKLRLFTIKEGAGKAVPIAVAISAPVKPNNLAPLTEEENALGWKEKNELVASRVNALRTVWLDSAKAAFTAAGWRIIELPKRRTYSWGNPPEIIWVTPFTAEQWSTVDAAAKSESQDFSMNGAGGY